MTRKIQRYTIEVTDGVQSIQIPKGGSITHVDSKSGLVFDDPDTPRVCIDFWVLYDETVEEVETRHFVVHQTGESIEDYPLTFVSTVIVKSEHLFGGAVAYHVFEKLV